MSFLKSIAVLGGLGGLALLASAGADAQRQHQRVLHRQTAARAVELGASVREAAQRNFSRRVTDLDEILASPIVCPEARAGLEDLRDTWAARAIKPRS